MLNEDKNEIDIRKHEDFNFLSDWSTHFQSWKSINFCPVKIIRYEDCLIDIQKVFISTLRIFIKIFKTSSLIKRKLIMRLILN